MLPPFRELDPELERAERLLEAGSLGRGGLASVLAALPDEDAAAGELNETLARYGAVPRLRREGGRWRLVVLTERSPSGETAAAAAALAALVAAAGWERVKRCVVTGCGRPFVDRTNGRTRHRCGEHVRHTGSGPL
ncbi:hypothetical protein ACFYSC_14800 [Streptosporangium sp. NPDC004379]|uniref:hypothetical protein n=1 Tax=Streptosporangium sp. NPDC004379 TaxID=3366189 RepID=UPI0036A5D512